MINWKFLLQEINAVWKKIYIYTYIFLIAVKVVENMRKNVFSNDI